MSEISEGGETTAKKRSRWEMAPERLTIVLTKEERAWVTEAMHIQTEYGEMRLSGMEFARRLLRSAMQRGRL